jgi:CHAD domain-containing protein
MARLSREPRNRVTIAKSSIADMALSTEARKFAGQNAVRLLGRLAFQMNVTRKSPDADAVHDLRVAIRRFAQPLSVFKPCFHGRETRKIRRRTKKLMILAGAVRNCDVALKLLSKSRSSQAADLRPKLQSQRKESERVLIGALKRRIERKSSLRWRTALEASLALGASPACRIPIDKTARRILPRMAKDFLERGSAVSQAKISPEKMHAFRIASKKFRYTLELFATLYGPALNGWLESIKRVQTLLGDINDCVTVAQLLSDYKSSGTMEAWLKKRQRRKVEEFSRCWAEEFGSRESVRSRIRSLSHPQETPRALKKPMASSRTAARPHTRRPSAVA